MQSVKLLPWLMLILWMTGCASGPETPTSINLSLPDSFRGEIFVLENQVSGQNWMSGSITVNARGIALVKDLAGLAKVLPDKFRASYPGGGRLKNSVLRTGNEVSLWPVTYVENLTLYFVVGTFHEKTQRENERMRGDWQELCRAKLTMQDEP